MRETLDRAWTEIRALVGRLSTAQKAIYATVLAGVLGGLTWLIVTGNQTHWAKAGTLGNPDEAKSAIAALEERKIPARLTDGAVVQVPEASVGEARMVLMAFAEDTGASVGMELFDKSTFGQSARQEQINYVRALEGELSRTIRSISGVRGARVHLAMPERTVFLREEKKPTASVTLSLGPGAEMDKKQVKAVQRLVANAVPGLVQDAVAVVDDQGSLLSRSDEDGLGETSFELANRVERDAENRLVAMLERIVGVGKARVQVSAVLDNSQVTENTTELNPDNQVVKSEDTSEESSLTQEDPATGTVGQAGNDPARAAGNTATPKTQRSKKHEQREYENAVTKRTVVQGGARVKQLAVSVVVDGVWKKSEGGEEAWTARTASELEAIEKAVRVGSGLDDARGDKLSVVCLPFEEPAAEPPPPEPALQPWMVELIRWGIVGLLVLVFIFAVVRPALALMKKEAPGLPAAGPTLALAEGLPAELGLLEAPDDEKHGSADPSADADEPAEEEDDDMKKSQSKSPSEIGEELRRSAIEATRQNPGRAVQLVRAWLQHEDANAPRRRAPTTPVNGGN